jgi:hypothetical protein
MTENNPMTTRSGQPFDHDLHTHIALSKLRVGDEVQADGGWNNLKPWSICTVQQANDGRLYIEAKDGSMFLDDFAAECDPETRDLIWGLFSVPLDRPIQ